MLGNRQNHTYLGIMGGKIVQKVPEGTDGAVQRINKSGVTVHEVRYDFVGGILREIGVSNNSEYGSQWLFTLQDGTETYCLQVSENSRALTSLLFALPNCDLKKPIAVYPYDFTDAEGKNRSGVTLKQDDKKIAWFFTRENPQGLPELQQVTLDGKETWDSSERMKFLRQYVDQHIVPQLTGSLAATEPENEPDDLPY
jgi:hypothetical protein